MYSWGVIVSLVSSGDMEDVIEFESWLTAKPLEPESQPVTVKATDASSIYSDSETDDTMDGEERQQSLEKLGG